MSSYYVRPTGKSWSLYEELWENSEREQKLVPKDAFPALGFRKDMSVEEARKRCKELNQTHSIERVKAGKAARNAKWTEIIESTFLPERLCQEFAKKLRDDSFGSEKHTQRLLSHWVTIQKLIKDLELDPSQFSDNENAIFHYFIENEWSIDYVKKLLRVLNLWGYFVTKRRGQFFEPITKIKPNIRELIIESNEDSDDTRGNKKSEPLTPLLLKKVRKELPEKNGNWVLVSFAFGLRPSEVDERKYRIEADDNGTTIVWVYQSKLVAIPKPLRWKPIAIQNEIQTEALKVWENGDIERPLVRNVQAVLGEGFTVYAGRKGFEKWLRDLGESLENISLMLGHQKLQTTWGHYTQKTPRYSIKKNKAKAS